MKVGTAIAVAQSGLHSEAQRAANAALQSVKPAEQVAEARPVVATQDSTVDKLRDQLREWIEPTQASWEAVVMYGVSSQRAGTPEDLEVKAEARGAAAYRKNAEAASHGEAAEPHSVVDVLA